ncbi:MAG: hypothetical protein WD894_22040 [Pirellulales bacterium]
MSVLCFVQMQATKTARDGGRGQQTESAYYTRRLPQQVSGTWFEAQLSERNAYQQRFCDLCDVLGQPKPADADRDGAWYTFERGVTRTDGENGWPAAS